MAGFVPLALCDDEFAAAEARQRTRNTGAPWPRQVKSSQVEGNQHSSSAPNPDLEVGSPGYDPAAVWSLEPRLGRSGYCPGRPEHYN